MGNWISLKNKEIVLTSGEVVYSKKDIIYIASLLLRDIGTDYFYNKVKLNDSDRIRLETAIIERFDLTCELCHKVETDLETIKVNYKITWNETPAFLKEIVICRECSSKLYKIEPFDYFRNGNKIERKIPSFIVKPGMFMDERTE
jgi:hypothetical protein